MDHNDPTGLAKDRPKAENVEDKIEKIEDSIKQSDVMDHTKKAIDSRPE